jgi:hypothetical protein
MLLRSIWNVAIERTNLAAAIRRLARLGLVSGQFEQNGQLTNEQAINLADWLQRESSIIAWRSIFSTPVSFAVDAMEPGPPLI